MKQLSEGRKMLQANLIMIYIIPKNISIAENQQNLETLFKEYNRLSFSKRNNFYFQNIY